MTCKLLESPMGSKDTVFRIFWIFAPSEGPKLLFQYLFLSMMYDNHKTASRILLLRKVSNLDYIEIVAAISYISFALKDSKKN